MPEFRTVSPRAVFHLAAGDETHGFRGGFEIKFVFENRARVCESFPGEQTRVENHAFIERCVAETNFVFRFKTAVKIIQNKFANLVRRFEINFIVENFISLDKTLRGKSRRHNGRRAFGREKGAGLPIEIVAESGFWFLVFGFW